MSTRQLISVRHMYVGCRVDSVGPGIQHMVCVQRATAPKLWPSWRASSSSSYEKHIARCEWGIIAYLNSLLSVLLSKLFQLIPPLAFLLPVSPGLLLQHVSRQHVCTQTHHYVYRSCALRHSMLIIGDHHAAQHLHQLHTIMPVTGLVAARLGGCA